MKYDYIKDFFPITEKSAYTLGFIFGDGYLQYRYDNYRMLEIMIVSSDGIELEKTFDFTNWKSQIKQRENRKEQIRFYINNTELCKHLAKLGFKDKSKIFPDITKFIPDKYIHIFLQGYIDADGSIFMKKCGSIFHITSGLDFDWTNLLKLIHTKVNNLTSFKIFKHKNNKGYGLSRIVCQHSKQNVKFLDYIYQDGNKYGLSRKYNEYLKLKEKYD